MMRAGQILQLVVASLLAVGVVMVSSAGMDLSGTTGGPAMPRWQAMLTSRHVIYAALALIAMLTAAQLDIRKAMRVRGWTNPVYIVFIFSLLLTVLTLVPGVGTTINGASRWLKVGAVTFQPSEMVKWSMVLVLAWWCTRKRGVMHTFRFGLIVPMVIIGFSCALIVIEDLGTAVLIGAVSMCILIAGGARWWHLALIVPPGIAGVVTAIIHSPYRVARLTSFMDPWADPRGTGYHAIQSMLAFAQGGLSGRGLGNGIQKFGYLPADTTDFVYAVICEELGITGAVAVIGLYLALVWIGLSIIKRAGDSFGRLVALGVITTVGLQAMINLAVVTVVIPTKGIALPLISAGGTGWVMTAFALGLVAGMDRPLDEPTVSISPAPPDKAGGLSGNTNVTRAVTT